MKRFDSDDLKTLGWAALMAPLCVVLHELGHYAIAVADGIPVSFNPASVTGLPGSESMTPSVPGLGAAMGPIVTLVLTFGAVLLLRRRIGPPKPLLAVALTAPARMIVLYAFLGFTLVRAISGKPPSRPNFDEYNALVQLGVPPVPVLVVIAVLLPLAWGLAIRTVPEGKRLRATVLMVLGAAIGLALWMKVVGPALLG